MATFCARRQLKLAQSFLFGSRTKLAALRNNPVYIPQRRCFSSFLRNVSFMKKKVSRTFLLVAGSAVSLGFVAFLQQNYSQASCDDTNEETGPRDVKKTGNSKCIPKTEYLTSAIEEARTFLEQVREETGVPGLSVAVSLNGKLAWSEGFGYADVENHVKCTPDSVMRIASISKMLTAVAVAKLYEENKLDIDAPVQQYVPAFPQKEFNNKPVTITTRQLLSHLGGIRHYRKESYKQGTPKQAEDSSLKSKEKEENDKETEKGTNNATESLENEYYMKEPKTMKEALAMFQDDPLHNEPGESFNYTTHGYMLVSAVVESAAQEDFLSYMKKMFHELGMKDTGPELNDQIIYNRSRFYQRGKRNGLINTPYVDNSYKWAGGGFVSTVKDLVKFGNAMLYAYQAEDCKNDMLPGILKPETVKEMLKKVDKTVNKKDQWYGWGCYIQPEKQTHGSCRHQKESIYHTGEAVGAVSILLIRPDNQEVNSPLSPPKGIVVAIIVNMQSFSRNLQGTAEHVADIFDKNL